MYVATVSSEKNQKKMIRRLKISPLRMAVIDLGTNSVRLDIYRINNKRITLLYRGKRMIRLGDGVFKTGSLTPEAMARTLRAFTYFRRLLIDEHVDHVVAFGTSALRTAKNAKAFLNLIREKTDISIRIISGQEEGSLIARGIMANVEIPKGHFGMIDIGGGSTEISLAVGKRILSCQSYPLGANRLQQMFFKNIPPRHRKGELNPVLALRQHLKDTLFPLQQMRLKYPVKTVIGSSGTIRTIGKILKKLQRSDRPVYRSDLSALIGEMQTMTREQLKRMPGLEPKRVDLILSGAILLEEIMIALNIRTLSITDVALRDGILNRELHEMRKKTPWKRAS